MHTGQNDVWLGVSNQNDASCTDAQCDSVLHWMPAGTYFTDGGNYVQLDADGNKVEVG